MTDASVRLGYVGLDGSLKETKLHVLDEPGNRVWRGRCATETRCNCCSGASVRSDRRPYWTRDWTIDHLALDCAHGRGLADDARHAKKALDMKVNKTDANDAEGLAHLVRAGKVAAPCWQGRCLTIFHNKYFRPYNCKTEPSHIMNR
jgi:hypothetical protein